jgi:CII-binding regulator of phage lambda lysogenization HflD
MFSLSVLKKKLKKCYEAKKTLQEEISILESRLESIQYVLADLKVQL